MERFGAFIGRVKQAVADGSGRNKALMGPITILLWWYLSRVLRRLSALHVKFVAGTLAAPCPREVAPERKAPEARPAKPRIPSGHVFIPYFVGHLHHAMRELIADPEMVALIQAAPQAGRILRPLWRRMTPDPLPEVLRLPKRPRRSRQKPPPEPEPEPRLKQAAPAASFRPSPYKPPRPRRQAVPEEERAVWLWHPPPLKRV